MSANVTGQKTEEMSGTGASMFVGGWRANEEFYNIFLVIQSLTPFSEERFKIINSD